MANEAKVVDALMKVARPILLSEFDARSCIASTRVGIDALDYFGIKGVPISLFMLIFNDEATRMLKEGMGLMDIKEATERLGLDEPGGPWTIGVGAEVENSDGWAGHLMIGLPQHRLLVDLSIDQASRPHKNITLTHPAAFPVESDDWWLGVDGADIITFDGEDEAGHPIYLALNRRAPDPDGFRKTRNWRRDSSKHGGRRVFQEVTGRVIRAMKEELA